MSTLEVVSPGAEEVPPQTSAFSFATCFTRKMKAPQVPLSKQRRADVVKHWGGWQRARMPGFTDEFSGTRSDLSPSSGTRFKIGEPELQLHCFLNMILT